MPGDNLIQLRDGPIVTAEAITLAIALEAEGRTLRARADGKLEVQPAAGLTEAQRQQIAACRLHLLALLAYEPPEPR